MPGPFNPEFEYQGPATIRDVPLVTPTLQTRSDEQRPYAYALWLDADQMRALGLPTGSYDVPPRFDELGPRQQVAAVNYIVLKGGHAVSAAGIEGRVREQGVGYRAILTPEETQRMGFNGTAVPFRHLSMANQKRVAGYVGAHGAEAVAFAGIAEFVEQHGVTVNSVEAHVQ